MARTREVKVPDIGDFDGVEVVEVLVSPGDAVKAEQSLIALESDKASMEVPAPFAGTVQALHVKVGDAIAKDTVIATLETSGEPAPSTDADPDPADTPAADAQSAETPADREAESTSAAHAAPPADSDAEADPGPAGFEPESDVRPAPPRSYDPGPRAIQRDPATIPWASPSVRRRARELDVDLAIVRGTGRNGRITRADVDAAAAAPAAAPAGRSALPPMPEIDFAHFGEIEHEPLTRINRLTGESVHRSWLHVPHVTQFDEADISELEAFRKASKERAEHEGVKLTFLAFLMGACAAALREFPRFNASLAPDRKSLVVKRYIHIGIAVDTPRGLVVPVIRDVGSKRIFELASELMDVSARARDGKLTPRDIRGGSFTISSLGGIGGTAFTPIVNAPEVAILGVSRSRMQPVWDGEAFVPRLMLPLALSYDHRVVDGAAGVRFTTRLAELLGDIRNLLL